MPPQKQRIMKTIYLVEAMRCNKDWTPDWITYQQAFSDKKKAYKKAKEYADTERRIFRLYGKVSMIWHSILKEYLVYNLDTNGLRASVKIKEIKYDDGE